MDQNTLFYGDNLDILRRYVADESVDLIYLDPPFNSNADYNVLFAEKDGTQPHSQIKAFKDTWTWDLEAAQGYAEVLRSRHDRIAKRLKGLHDVIGGSDMLAYLAINLIKVRLADAFGKNVAYKVVGEPRDLQSARALAAAEKYQFQYWALGLVGARPIEEK
jgi:hypothetical protein